MLLLSVQGADKNLNCKIPSKRQRAQTQGALGETLGLWKSLFHFAQNGNPVKLWLIQVRKEHIFF